MQGGGPAKRRALVIGGSMSGLLAGLKLRERLAAWQGGARAKAAD